jgi:CheY-like chemotaxis protein
MSARRPRVLLVEDNAVNRYLVRYLLERADCRVAEVEDGAGALAAAQRERPDLILLDIQLPGLSGYEALGRIRADPELAGVPVVALTAHAAPQDRARALAAGCVDHIGKPIDVEGFVARLRPWLGTGSG